MAIAPPTCVGSQRDRSLPPCWDRPSQVDLSSQPHTRGLEHPVRHQLTIFINDISQIPKASPAGLAAQDPKSGDPGVPGTRDVFQSVPALKCVVDEISRAEKEKCGDDCSLGYSQY
jgi:hypothetical protein